MKDRINEIKGSFWSRFIIDSIVISTFSIGVRIRKRCLNNRSLYVVPEHVFCLSSALGLKCLTDSGFGTFCKPLGNREVSSIALL